MKKCAMLLLVLGLGCHDFANKDQEILDTYNEANAVFDAGNYEAAASLYRDVIKVRPRIVDAYVKLWQCDLRGGDPGAHAWLERGRIVCGMNVVVVLPLARVYASMGRRNDAREIFAALLPAHPELKEEMESLGLR